MQSRKLTFRGTRYQQSAMDSEIENFAFFKEHVTRALIVVSWTTQNSRNFGFRVKAPIIMKSIENNIPEGRKTLRVFEKKNVITYL